MNENKKGGNMGVLPFVLEEMCFIPISFIHQHDIFLFLLNRGLYKEVINHCHIIHQHIFEGKIADYPLLKEAHVEFYHIQNEYWQGSDHIDGDHIEIYITIRGKVIQWFFIFSFRESK